MRRAFLVRDSAGGRIRFGLARDGGGACRPGGYQGERGEGKSRARPLAIRLRCGPSLLLAPSLFFGEYFARGYRSLRASTAYAVAASLMKRPTPAAQRLEDLIRAQNPAAGAQPPVGFEHLVQQLYLTAMLQMGAGTQEGQRPRVDIVGARTTVDLLGILAEKTRGNLNSTEDRMLQSVLFEARMAFLELTSMMTMQPVAPAPPPGKK